MSVLISGCAHDDITKDTRAINNMNLIVFFILAPPPSDLYGPFNSIIKSAKFRYNDYYSHFILKMRIIDSFNTMFHNTVMLKLQL